MSTSAAAETASPRTLLVGTDFSPAADRALAWAAELAGRLGHAIEIAHVQFAGAYVLPPPIDVLPIAVESDDDLEALRASLAKCAETVARSGIPISTRLLFGEPAAELNARAKEMEAFALAVGMRGAGALAHALLGSVAEKVVRHATRPVFVVPSPR